MDTNLRNLRQRVRAGDHAAFGDLFDAYARSVYNHAFRLTGEWATAEDIVSLTFLDAWRLRETKEFLGEREVAVEDLPSGFEKGEVTGRFAVLERAVVDRRGERP